MALLLIIVFAMGYVLIALEQPLKLDKAATALLTGTLCWILLRAGDAGMVTHGHATAFSMQDALFEHLGKISEILFFLLGAMTIVELMDAHDGFSVITDRIRTDRRIALLWLIAWVSFFLSAILDNMTTSIIMCALLRRILKEEADIWKLGGFVIIAANAGGAWSPIGDVTTIMLWIGGQVTSGGIMRSIFVESVLCLLVPLLIASVFMKGRVTLRKDSTDDEAKLPLWERNLIFFAGAGALLGVPVFKQLTHFPPYLGVLLALGVVWYITEWMHRRKEDSLREDLSVAATLRRIDTPSILFFLGILLAVAALDTGGHLRTAAVYLDTWVHGDAYLLNTLIGFLSAVVDNVPLVAAAMAMYDMQTYPTDHLFWQLLAFCAGTGGSLLIIGSAAGVAAMGLLKINFLWYLRHISPYALAGYASGIIYYIIFA